MTTQLQRAVAIASYLVHIYVASCILELLKAEGQTSDTFIHIHTQTAVALHTISHLYLYSYITLQANQQCFLSLTKQYFISVSTYNSYYSQLAMHCTKLFKLLWQQSGLPTQLIVLNTTAAKPFTLLNSRYPVNSPGYW